VLAGLREAASRIEQQLHDFLSPRDPEAAQSAAKARLLNCIAHGLYWLDELPDLRWQIREQRVTTAEATARFTRLIGSLLSIIFEAADTALDPGVTRTLVALFNFVQGKELSGQERAHGVVGFTAGHFADTEKVRMSELLDGQLRSFDVFEQYAPAAALAPWHEARAKDAQIEQMRGIARNTRADIPVDPGLSALWYEICTERIDAMRSIERLLTEALMKECRRRLEETRAELDNQRLLLAHFDDRLEADNPALLFNIQARILGTPPRDGVGHEMERSLLDLIREQMQRAQETEETLRATRHALNERSRVEQAKWLLINRQGLTEQAAHARLQHAAMNNGLPIGEIARRVLETYGDDTNTGG
jgi:hypothetical protein